MVLLKPVIMAISLEFIQIKFDRRKSRQLWLRGGLETRLLMTLIRHNTTQGESPPGMFSIFSFSLLSHRVNMAITPQGTPWCLEKVKRPGMRQQRLLACIFIRPNGRERTTCWFSGASISFFFRLAKASAAWDGGAVRLLAPTNKDSERRSLLFCLFFPLCTVSICVFSLSRSVRIHSTLSQVAKNLNLYCGLYSNPSFEINF